MLPITLIMVLLAAILFLLAVLDVQPNKTVPAGLFFLAMYFLIGGIGR
jgi:hypothetical protein